MFLSTHDVGGISQKDIALAKKIDDLINWDPSKDDGSLEGNPLGSEHRYIAK